MNAAFAAKNFVYCFFSKENTGFFNNLCCLLPIELQLRQLYFSVYSQLSMSWLVTLPDHAATFETLKLLPFFQWFFGRKYIHPTLRSLSTSQIVIDLFARRGMSPWKRFRVGFETVSRKWLCVLKWDVFVFLQLFLQSAFLSLRNDSCVVRWFWTNSHNVLVKFLFVSWKFNFLAGA